MLNIILFTLIILSFFGGIVAFFFPFGKEKVTAANTTPAATKSAAQVSLEEIRNQAHTSTDMQVLVIWFNQFYGYKSEIPSSVRYLHMLEWRALVDERYQTLPSEIAPLWATLVHRNGGGSFSGGWK